MPQPKVRYFIICNASLLCESFSRFCAFLCWCFEYFV